MIVRSSHFESQLISYSPCPDTSMLQTKTHTYLPFLKKMSSNVQELRVIRSDSIAFCPWFCVPVHGPTCWRLQYRDSSRSRSLCVHLEFHVDAVCVQRLRACALPHADLLIVRSLHFESQVIPHSPCPDTSMLQTKTHTYLPFLKKMSANIQQLRVMWSDSIAFCPWFFMTVHSPTCWRLPYRDPSLSRSLRIHLEFHVDAVCVQRLRTRILPHAGLLIVRSSHFESQLISYSPCPDTSMLQTKTHTYLHFLKKMSPNVQELRVIQSDYIAFCPCFFYARS